MKIAVVGSRSFHNYEKLKSVLQRYEITEVISGGAVGADALAKKYAQEFNINLTEFIPDWKTYGRGAGVIRNKEIVMQADKVIAFWDGVSNGAKMTISFAKKLDKDVLVIIAEVEQ